MALDTTQLIVDDSRFTNTANTILQTVRTGIDDGVDFTLGQVVREIDGILRLATDREATAYQSRATAVVAEAALKARAGDIDVIAPTPLAVKEYLKAKFPEDFS